MASLYDSASLVMLPSGVKESKVYSIKPTDGSGDFTFSRGTDTATRVNASGLIEKERSNQLLQSNSFDTTWTNFNSTETSGQSGYDGSSDAWLIDKTGANGNINQTASFSGVYTFSVYAKKGTDDWIQIRMGSATLHEAFFDLNSGAVGTESNLIESSIEAVGSGWYRCSITANVSSVTYLRIYVADADNDTSGSSGTIFIQDAQLEQGLVATDYIETTTAAVYEGITDNLPRLDYSGGASCPSLLLEPSRTNLTADSEYFNGGIWIQTGSSVTDNDTTSPEGLTNAAKVEGDGSESYIRLYDNYTFPSTGNYTLSVFAKAGNNDFLRMQFGGVTGAQNAYFDLVNGTTEESWASIEPVGTDGWYRCSITADLTGPDLTGNYNFFPSYSYTTSTFPSNGDANGQYVYLYGAQAEAGSYPTSYIPTYGTSASRAGDSCVKTSATDLIGQTEGVVFCEVNMTEKTMASSWAFSLNDGTTSNYIGLRRSGGNELFAHINVSGTTTALIATGITTGTHKIAIAYANNDIAVYVDGISVGTDTSSAIPATSVIEIGDLVSNRYFDDSVKQFLLFKTRLTNAELASLTA